MASTSISRLPQFTVIIRPAEFAAKKTLFPVDFLNDYACDIQDSVKFCMPSGDSGVEAAYPRSEFALMDGNVMHVDEGFTRD
ncbi:hypothetical protein ACH5RR_020737 [Cinchona calisaya]|uniref:Uncharacterized protein n=1 Tax=Cinchona calisaya TaxID=153742 RepID=A0ABD2ZKC0_9GENT